MIKIPKTSFECYLPKYFTVQEDPSGVIHSASGTFVIAVKVPPDKRMDMNEGIPRSFFENPAYEIVSLKEEDAPLRIKRTNSRMYWMRYRIRGHEFERHTVLVNSTGGQYLLISNYTVKLRDQVLEEVEKILTSFKIP